MTGDLESTLSGSASVVNCSVTGKIVSVSPPDGDLSHAGGIAGRTDYATVKGCFFNGTVSGAVGIGGIVGFSNECLILDSMVFGEILSPEPNGTTARAGGIAGVATYGTKITNCVYFGTGGGNVAAIAGHVWWLWYEYGEWLEVHTEPEPNELTLTNCLYNADAFLGGRLTFLEEERYQNQNSRALTTEEMRNKDSFPGFDFDSVWGFDQGGNLVLRAFGNAYDPPVPEPANLWWLWITLGSLLCAGLIFAIALNIYRARNPVVVTETETVQVEVPVEVVREVPVMNGRPLPMEIFTPREKSVAELLLLGKSYAEIASALKIGEATAKTHILNVFSKTEVRSQKAFISEYLRSEDK